MIHAFGGTGDGAEPEAKLIFDSRGNLYGTTVLGGKFGGGIVFQLIPPVTKGAAWTENILYNFCSASNCSDGSSPEGGVVFNKLGNLYGATALGGRYDGGTVFELKTPSQERGPWAETVLYNFGQNGINGKPFCDLLLDEAGAIYGTTYGAPVGNGTVFKLIPPTSNGGGWTEKLLHVFQGGDGLFPDGGVIFDDVGNLYGTTTQGGTANNGTVFKLTRPRGGRSWKETVLYNFAGGNDSSYPWGELAFDRAGNLYGSADLGGGPLGAGTIFELSPPSHGGQWKETVLHRFNSIEDGLFSSQGVLLRGDTLYGATLDGGSANAGTVFEILPY